MDGVKEMLIRDNPQGAIILSGMDYIDYLYAKFGAVIVEDIGIQKFGEFLRMLRDLSQKKLAE